MNRSARIALTTILLLVPAFALAQAPTIGSWLTSRKLAANADTRATWGAAKDTGWTAFPQRAVTININGAAHPLCVSAPGSGNSGLGWAGIGSATPRGADIIIMRCRTHSGDTDGGWAFEYAANKPAPLWINTSASTPEPQGAIALATQAASGRPVYACQFDQGGKFVGHIGDDGKCYGANTGGGKATATTYQTLVSKGTGADAQPRYGWVAAGSGFIPHGALATGGVDGIRGGNAITKTICRAANGGHTWPGWVEGTGCTYFTYFGDATTKKTANKYEVLRVKSGAPKAPYVFNRFGGKNFYACTAEYSVSGKNVHVIFGFTNNTASCTDGSKSTDVKPDKFGGWSKIRMIELPNTDGDRA
jgi:hypothetical protein